MSRRVVRPARSAPEILNSESIDDLLDQTSETDATCGLLFSDASVAELLVREEFSGKLRHARGLGWLRWDGKRWEDAADKDAVETARQWVLQKYTEAAAAKVVAAMAGDKLSVKEAEAAERGWWSFQSKSKLDAIVKLASGIEGVTTDANAFDSDPDLLNAQNGVVDLRTGELTQHDPDLLMTKIANAQYMPKALVKNQDWAKALEAIPADVREWYQTRMGQAITGHRPPDDVMLIQQGSGANGKSTLMVGMERALGDYYLVVPFKALLGDAKSHSTELTEFKGRRLAVLEELPEGNQLNVQRLKQTVGTPTMSARRMRQDEITFSTSHSLVINTNYMPGVHETDHGTWRRLLLLRFPYTYTATPTEANDRPGDTGLRQRIERGKQGQHSAILTWLVHGAVRWYQNDEVMPEPPERVVADTEEWRTDSDVVYSYVTENLVMDRDYYIMATDLYAEMRRCLDASGKQKWSDTLLAGRLKNHDTMKDVERKKIRASPGKRSEPDDWGAEKPTGTFAAYVGVRFRNRSDQAERGRVPGVPAHPVDTMEDPSREGKREYPEHPEQTRRLRVVPRVAGGAR